LECPTAVSLLLELFWGREQQLALLRPFARLAAREVFSVLINDGDSHFVELLLCRFYADILRYPRGVLLLGCARCVFLRASRSF